MTTETNVSTAAPEPAAPAPGSTVPTAKMPAETASQTPETIAARTGVPITPIVTATKATPGEKLYKAVVHVGINTILNEGIGLFFMWAGEFGKGKGFPLDHIWAMTNKVKPQVTKAFQKIGMGEVLAKNISNEGVNILLLTMGGNSLLVPIKLIENDKLNWVKKADAFLDKMHGHSDIGVQEKADREAAYKRIEDEVKPSWGRILVARGSALAYNTAMFAAWRGLDKNAVDQERRGAGRVTHWMAESKGSQNLEKLLTKKITPPDAVSKVANWPWWIRGITLETMSTLHCSAAFFAKYELFDRRKEKKELAAKTAAEAAANGGSVAGSNAGTNASTMNDEYHTSELLHKAVIIPQATDAQKAAEQAATNPPDIIAMTAAVPNAQVPNAQMPETQTRTSMANSASSGTTKELALQSIAEGSPESTPAAAMKHTDRIAPRAKTEARGEDFTSAARTEAEHLANAGHAMGA